MPKIYVVGFDGSDDGLTAIEAGTMYASIAQQPEELGKASVDAVLALIAGDAVPTVEHLAAGQVLSPAFDLEAARESFAEAVEIADWIVCGRDNLVPNQTRI